MADITASPTVPIYKGDTATLTWHTSNANTVEIQPLGPKGRNGQLTVSPIATTTYTLIAKGNFETAREDVTVVVGEERPQVGCLALSFGFTWGYPGELFGDLPVTVHFHGQLKSDPIPNNSASMFFDQTKTYTLTYPNTPTWTGISENFNGLMPGTWSVSAQYLGGMGGLRRYDTPIICTGIVSAGPACGSVRFNHDSQSCSQ